VIQLYDPSRDTLGHRDVPCTLSYRFYLRQHRLHMHTTMRSQDLWFGFPYDVFTATLIQELLAGWLGVELGDYHHHIDSLHLYDKHLDAARQVPDAPAPSAAMPPIGVEWDNAATVFADTIDDPAAPGLLPAWSSFAVILASYRTWTAGQRDEARAMVADLDHQLAHALLRWYDHLSHRTTETEVAS
jgi:thymidylate synthase